MCASNSWCTATAIVEVETNLIKEVCGGAEETETDAECASGAAAMGSGMLLLIHQVRVLNVLPEPRRP